jgi:hypothetical protein
VVGVTDAPDRTTTIGSDARAESVTAADTAGARTDVGPGADAGATGSDPLDAAGPATTGPAPDRPDDATDAAAGVLDDLEIDPSSNEGRPTTLSGTAATAVAGVVATVVGTATGMPLSAVVTVVGAALLALAVPRLADDEPRRVATGSLLLVPGSVATGLAPTLTPSIDPLQFFVLLAGGVSVFAAGTDALGGFTSNRLASTAVTLLGALSAAVGGGIVAVLSHEFGAFWPAIPLGATLDALATVGTVNLAAFAALMLFGTATAAALGNALGNALPLEVLSREPLGVAESTVDRIEAAVDALSIGRRLYVVPTAAAVILGLFAAAVAETPTSAPAWLSVVPDALGGVVAATFGVVLALVGGLLGQIAAVRVSRWSPRTTLRRAARAAGAGGAALVGGVLSLPVISGTLLDALPTGLTNTASSLGILGTTMFGTAIGLGLALCVTTVLLVTTATPLTPSRATGFALSAGLVGTLGVLSGVLLGGTAGAGAAAFGLPALVTFGAVAAALFVWDLGEHATTLGAQVGREAPSARVELVHVAAGLGVTVASVALAGAATLAAPVLGGLASPGAAVLATALLLVGVLLLVGELKTTDAADG